MSNQKQEITINEFATKVSQCFFLEPECETLAEELRCLNLCEIPSVLTKKDFGFTKEQFEEACKFFKTSKIKKIDNDRYEIFLVIYIKTIYNEMCGIFPTLLENFVDNPEFDKAITSSELYGEVSTFFKTHKTWKKPIENWNCLLEELDEELGLCNEADF